MRSKQPGRIGGRRERLVETNRERERERQAGRLVDSKGKLSPSIGLYACVCVFVVIRLTASQLARP